MSSTHHSIVRLLSCLLLAVFGLRTVHGAEPPPQRTGASASLLDKRISIAAEEPVGLEEVVEHLSQQSGITLRLRKWAFETQGNDVSRPSPLVLENVRLGAALRILSLQCGFDIVPVIENESIQLTTAEDAAKRKLTNTYRVAAFVVHDAPDQRQVERELGAALEALEDFERAEWWCTPAWQAGGGYGHWSVVRSSGSLVVSQTPSLQRAIERLLVALGEAQTVNRRADARLESASPDELVRLYPAVSAERPATEAEVALQTALRTKHEFPAQALTKPDLIDWLRERFRISVILDEASLRNMDERASRRWLVGEAMHATLADYLAFTLAQSNLAYRTFDGFLVIRGNEDKTDCPVTKVYPVGDFVGAAPRTRQRDLLHALSTNLRLHTYRPNSFFSPVVVAVPITRSLVVVATESGHAEVENLLTAWRRARGGKPAEAPAAVRLVGRRYSLYDGDLKLAATSRVVRLASQIMTTVCRQLDEPAGSVEPLDEYLVVTCSETAQQRLAEELGRLGLSLVEGDSSM